MLQHFKHHQFFYIFIPYYEKDKRFKSERNFEIFKKKKRTKIQRTRVSFVS